MTNRSLYVAYPIDQQPAASMAGFYELVNYGEQYFLGTGLVQMMYDPGDAFTVESLRGVKELSTMIAKVNAYALKQADVVLAFLPAGVPTIGVPIEIDRAVAAGKWVVLLTDTRSFSLQEYHDRNNVIVGEMTQEGVRAAADVLSARIAEGPPVRRLGGDEYSLLPVLLGPGGRLPSRGYDDDAGLDLYVVGDHVIRAGEFVDVACAVSIELPSWTWGLITGRSSTLRNKQLLVHSGIIDPGWRGELFAGTMNVGKEERVVLDGDRIAQLILLPNVTREFLPGEVQSLREHPRGINGFGSTGD